MGRPHLSLPLISFLCDLPLQTLRIYVRFKNSGREILRVEYPPPLDYLENE